MKTIEIGGWTYTVRFADEILVDGPDGSIDANGSINGRRREIKLRRDQTVDSAIETVLHEVGHGWRNHHAAPADEECAAKDMASAIWTVHRWLTTERVVEWLGQELGRNDVDPDSPVKWAELDGQERRRAVIRHVVCRGLTDELAAVFIAKCEAIGADPLAGDCYPRVQYDQRSRREDVLCLSTYDGIRRRAERTGEFEGFTEPTWCGDDEVWRKQWIRTEPPAAAKIGVRRRGFPEPVYAVANFRAYAQYEEATDGTPELSPFWKRMHYHMLLKCAKVLALRDAFANVCAGLLIPEELQMAGAERRREKAETHRAPRTRVELESMLRGRGLDVTAIRRALDVVEEQAPDLQDESPETWANQVSDLAKRIMRGGRELIRT